MYNKSAKWSIKKSTKSRKNIDNQQKQDYYGIVINILLNMTIKKWR